jgi:hypothetical protein
VAVSGTAWGRWGEQKAGWVWLARTAGEQSQSLLLPEATQGLPHPNFHLEPSSSQKAVNWGACC